MSLSIQILQYFISGLVVGSIYAIIALGFVTIYNITGIINFAQGEFVMLGGIIMFTLCQIKIPLIISFFLSLAFVVLIGALIERMAINPAKGAGVITLIIITIGASISIRGIALLLWGTDPLVVRAYSEGPSIAFFGVRIVRQGIWVLTITLLIVIGLYIFFDKTFTGKAVRACAINPTAARLVGISVNKMSLLSFAISGGLGASAGMIIAPITYVTYDMGVMLGLKGFVAMVIGGLSSAPGAVIGGLVLGILESLGAGLVSSGYKDAIAFMILLIVLFIRSGTVWEGRGSVEK